MLYGLILIVHTFVCFVLIAVILLQAGRGGGLTDSFGGGGGQSLFGTRGAVYLTRATSACATIFMLTSLTLAVLSAQRGRSLLERAPVPTAKSESTAQPEPTEKPTESTSREPESSPSGPSSKP